MEEDEVDLLALLQGLWRQGRFIGSVTVAVAALAAVVAFLLPKQYTATVRLMPPQQNQSSMMASLAGLGGLAGGAANALGIKNPNDMYVGMLKSRTVADSLISKFQLEQVLRHGSA
ncbi:MAG: Wzz/FepE/Etk N-terminal domain-containing protein [Rhodocyclaceae bacterium]